MQLLKGKHIVLGITGSIAAYKACTLIRLLIKAGAEVQVVITPAGKEFITPLTLSTLTGKPVVSEFFDRRDGSWHSHVDLGQWADLMLVAPASASTIAKMAHGVADNMLITTYLSMKAPVMLAPAMDLDMYAHPATQANLDILRGYGNIVIEAASGELASHLVGKGRMEEPETILRHVIHKLATTNELAGRRILITAGPTYERLDPVRYIGNFSTGKMGLALAEACALRGAEVQLVAGPVQLATFHPNIHRTNVESAQQMYEAATQLFPTCEAAILCAAVADFTPVSCADEKIKRKGPISLALEPTHDIAAALGQMKTASQRLVGFALETQNEMGNAREKLTRKNLDLIVLNTLRDEGAGFGHDTNKVTILTPNGQQAFPLKSKAEVAHDIISSLCDILD
ncbi:MAG: bifunctional phosphopantothenoylcysteine decarboxylase/phosphopantothenate--cysteine ligase CoaBC [Bacteroidales bacterium]|nr:bifunctional phosphopantothenoylcysteine decarboxylase/phosphopantothenate--cysteine ligase CoaBC [Bacteroidales bacterium]